MIPPVPAQPTPLASHYLIAYMEASGKAPREIGQKLGKSTAWVNARRRDASYPMVLQQAQDDITSRIAENTADLAGKFDGEAENSFTTMVEIRDAREELGSTRLKAAEAILDRAPNAPKKRTEHYSEQRRTVVNIPLQQVGWMHQALTEAGEDDVVELLDYTVSVVGDEGKDGGISVEVPDDDEAYRVTEL